VWVSNRSERRPRKLWQQNDRISKAHRLRIGFRDDRKHGRSHELAKSFDEGGIETPSASVLHADDHELESVFRGAADEIGKQARATRCAYRRAHARAPEAAFDFSKLTRRASEPPLRV
jgi:hypothetical protein